MDCAPEPGGVVAGVFGPRFECESGMLPLLRPVSMEMGFGPWPLLMPCWFHWKLSEAPTPPRRLLALVGGVGMGNGRSIGGRPIEGCCGCDGSWGGGSGIW